MKSLITEFVNSDFSIMRDEDEEIIYIIDNSKNKIVDSYLELEYARYKFKFKDINYLIDTRTKYSVYVQIAKVGEHTYELTEYDKSRLKYMFSYSYLISNMKPSLVSLDCERVMKDILFKPKGTVILQEKIITPNFAIMSV